MKRLITCLCLLVVTGFMSTEVFAANNSGLQSGSSGSEANKIGGAGVQFLKIGLGARGTAMGGAQGACSNDLTSIFWNPAGIGNIDKISATFTYTDWFSSYKHLFAAVSIPVSKDYKVAVGVISLSSGDIEITDLANPNGTGTNYNVQDVSMNVTFAGKLTEQFTFGITGKLVNSTFASMEASAVAFDVGTRYNTGIFGTTLAFSIQNLGGEMKYRGVDLYRQYAVEQTLQNSLIGSELRSSGFNMPLIFRAALASEIYKEDEHAVIGAMDFVTISDVAEQFSIGAEYTWDELISGRLGYKFGSDTEGISFGFGVNYEGGGFDSNFNYSFSPSSAKALGHIHRFGVNLKLQD